MRLWWFIDSRWRMLFSSTFKGKVRCILPMKCSLHTIVALLITRVYIWYTWVRFDPNLICTCMHEFQAKRILMRIMRFGARFAHNLAAVHGERHSIVVLYREGKVQCMRRIRERMVRQAAQQGKRTSSSDNEINCMCILAIKIRRCIVKPSQFG